MSSDIFKLFIKDVFYASQLYENFLQKKNNLESIKWTNIWNLSIKRFFKLLRSLYSEEIYFDFWLVKQ